MDLSVHIQETIPLSLFIGERTSWQGPNYCWFRAFKYIMQRMLQSLFPFWSRIRVFVVFESALTWRKWNGTLEENAHSFAFCGKSCSINWIGFSTISWVFMNRIKCHLRALQCVGLCPQMPVCHLNSIFRVCLWYQHWCCICLSLWSRTYFSVSRETDGHSRL